MNHWSLVLVKMLNELALTPAGKLKLYVPTVPVPTDNGKANTVE
jgi:hypothetical protein